MNDIVRTDVASGQPKVAAPSMRDAALITAGHALTHWYPATFYLLLPLIGAELGLNYSQIGLLLSCQYVAGAIANVPGGILVDTVGRKGFLMAASLFWVGFPYLLIGLTHHYALLLVCVVMVGFGNSLWHPTAIPTLASRYPQRKGLVLSIHGMGGNAGDALAPLATGALLAIFGWRQVVMLNLAPGVVMACLVLFTLGGLRMTSRRGAADEKQEGRSLLLYWRDLRVLLRNRSLLMISTSSAFRSMTQNTLLTFLPLFLTHQLGYSTSLAGVCMFALQAAGFSAAPVAGYLSDRMGRRNVLMSAMGMTAAVLLFMAFAGQSRAFVFFIAALGFFLYAIRPVIQAWLLDVTPSNMSGSSIGVLFGAQSLGSSVAPLLGGVIADQFGIQATFYFLAGTIVCANLFIFFTPAFSARSAQER